MPFAKTQQTLKEKLLLGQNIMETIRSEDLDDFIDGLAGGMTSSIMIHIKKLLDADVMWQEIFKCLGISIKEAFAYNPYRKKVTPGTKATLA